MKKTGGQNYGREDRAPEKLTPLPENFLKYFKKIPPRALFGLAINGFTYPFDEKPELIESKLLDESREELYNNTLTSLAETDPELSAQLDAHIKKQQKLNQVVLQNQETLASQEVPIEIDAVELNPENNPDNQSTVKEETNKSKKQNKYSNKLKNDIEVAIDLILEKNPNATITIAKIQELVKNTELSELTNPQINSIISNIKRKLRKTSSNNSTVPALEEDTVEETGHQISAKKSDTSENKTRKSFQPLFTTNQKNAIQSALESYLHNNKEREIVVSELLGLIDNSVNLVKYTDRQIYNLAYRIKNKLYPKEKTSTKNTKPKKIPNKISQTKTTKPKKEIQISLLNEEQLLGIALNGGKKNTIVASLLEILPKPTGDLPAILVENVPEGLEIERISLTPTDIKNLITLASNLPEKNEKRIIIIQDNEQFILQVLFKQISLSEKSN